MAVESHYEYQRYVTVKECIPRIAFVIYLYLFNAKAPVIRTQEMCVLFC